MARKRKNWDEAFTVRLGADEASSVRQIADARKISYSDLIREAVRAYMEPGPLLAGRVIMQDYSAWSVPEMPHARVTYDKDFVRGVSPSTVSSAALLG